MYVVNAASSVLALSGTNRRTNVESSTAWSVLLYIKIMNNGTELQNVTWPWSGIEGASINCG